MKFTIFETLTSIQKMGCLKLTYKRNNATLKVAYSLYRENQKYCTGSYRYGFNGKEKDNEVSGDGNSYDFGDRIYDPRLARWVAVDNRAHLYVPISPYAFALNVPLYFIDRDGNVVYGTDGKPVTIEKGKNGGYEIKGSPDASTYKLFSSMIKTPSGGEAARDYVTSKYEFKFKEKPKNDITNNEHAETYEVDDKGNRLSEKGAGEFHHFQVDYTAENTTATDRMNTWTEDEKLNAIGTHEKGHISKGGFIVDADHTEKNGTLNAELTSRYEYLILYPKESSAKEKWEGNYVKKMDEKAVTKAYSEAVNNLVKNKNITKADGDKLIKDFKISPPPTDKKETK